MFDSLDETMKHDQKQMSTPMERMLRYAAIAAVSVVTFGLLVVAIRFAG